jgi:hypothetical protein
VSKSTPRKQSRRKTAGRRSTHQEDATGLLEVEKYLHRLKARRDFWTGRVVVKGIEK